MGLTEFCDAQRGAIHAPLPPPLLAKRCDDGGATELTLPPAKLSNTDAPFTSGARRSLTRAFVFHLEHLNLEPTGDAEKATRATEKI